MPKRNKRPSRHEDAATKELETQLYENSRAVIKEFVDDGIVSGFADIPMNVWYNALSSICALALRIPSIQGNERLQEAIVYQVMLMIIENDLPVEEDVRRAVLAVYERIAPTAIDILIPGDGDCCGCW